MVTSGDLMSPVGPVENTLFPDTDTRDIATIVTAKITAAYADGRVAAITDIDKKDRAAGFLALYYIFDSIALRMTAEPLTVNNGVEQGTTQYNVQQVNLMQARANGYLAQLNGLLVANSPAPRPLAARNVFTW